MIGAGGAARGISYALHRAGYGPIVFVNRTIEKAQLLSDELADSSVMTVTEAEASLAEFGLVVQTTSLGMSFAQEGMPLDPKNLAEGTIVADIIYNPLETKLLAESRKRKALIMNGTGMFVHQGALAFEKWIDIRPNTEKMIKKITTKPWRFLC